MGIKQHTTPCTGCPFRKTVKPNALGGSHPVVYIGQAHGPFFLPCHSTHDYTSDECRRDPNNHQCAGAAIFRANVDRARLMPRQLLHLDRNTEIVFGGYAEFLAHHAEIPLTEAAAYLESVTPDMLLAAQMQRQSTTTMEIPK